MAETSDSADSAPDPGSQSAGSKKRSGLEGPALTLLVWLTFLGFGGGLLSMYYAGIGYFPEVQWDQALTYLGVVSILGGSVVVVYSLFLIVPGLIWSQRLVYDDELRKWLCWGPGGSSGKPCTLTVVQKLVVPFAVFMLGIHLFLLLDWWWKIALITLLWLLLVWMFHDQVRVEIGCTQKTGAPQGLACGTPAALDPLQSYPWPAAGKAGASGEDLPPKCGERREYSRFPVVDSLAYALWSLGYLFGDLWRLVRGKEIQTRDHRECRSFWLTYSFWFGASLLVGLVSLIIIYEIAAPRGEACAQAWAMLIICTIGVTVANIMFMRLYGHDKPAAFGSVLVVAVLLIAAGEIVAGNAAFSSRIMGRFGFRGAQQSILVTEEGRELLGRLGLPATCFRSNGATVGCFAQECPERTQERSKSEGDGAGDGAAVADCVEFDGARVDGVQVLSRLGGEYLLRKDQAKFALPKQWVISWIEPARPVSRPEMHPSPLGRYGAKPSK
jgi:hypothetical protein